MQSRDDVYSDIQRTKIANPWIKQMRIQYGDEPVKDAVKEVNQDDVIEYVCVCV